MAMKLTATTHRAFHQLCLFLFCCFPGRSVLGLVTRSPRTITNKYLAPLNSHHHNSFNENTDDRSKRRFLESVALGAGGILGVGYGETANASAPLTAGQVDNVKARLERSMRPKPFKVLRPNLSQDFAVLLMRSSYNALDEIDCVAMDQFQRDFFLIRQAEYQPYVQLLGGAGSVQQGILQDPLYFDFISFAQYATISREIQEAAYVYEEQQPQDMGEDKPMKFTPIIVRRDPNVLSNEMLPVAHNQKVGEAIINKLESTFAGTTSQLPPLNASVERSNEAVLKSLSQLMKLFLVNGFAWDAKIELVQNNTAAEIKVKFISPANLWSGKALSYRKAIVTNDFFRKAALIWLEKGGFKVIKSSVSYTDTEEITSISFI